MVAVLQDWDEPREDFLRQVKALGTAVRVVIVHEGPTAKPWAGAEELGEVSLMSVADVERALAGERSCLPARHSGRPPVFERTRSWKGVDVALFGLVVSASLALVFAWGGALPRLLLAVDALAFGFEPRPLPRSVFQAAERAAWVVLFLAGLFGLAWTIYPLIPAVVVRVFPTFAGYALASPVRGLPVLAAGSGIRVAPSSPPRSECWSWPPSTPWPPCAYPWSWPRCRS